MVNEAYTDAEREGCLSMQTLNAGEEEPRIGLDMPEPDALQLYGNVRSGPDAERQALLVKAFLPLGDAACHRQLFGNLN
jgi:hypothetical protein